MVRVKIDPASVCRIHLALARDRLLKMPKTRPSRAPTR
jgi:hypothetical protein